MYHLSFLREADHQLIQLDSHQLIQKYLDYRNNFLSIEVYASFYGWSDYEATRIIETGRKAHESHVQKIKETNT